MEKLSFVALDFETATTSKSICQIGLVKVENSCIVAEKCWLIKPPANKYDARCIDVHHITPNQTANMPEFHQVWPEVFEYLNNAIVVAHHAKSVELAALTYALEEYDIDRNASLWPQFICYCSCEIAKQSMMFSNNGLGDLAEHYDIRFKHHNALEDAKATAILMFKMQADGIFCTFADLKCIPYDNTYHVKSARRKPSYKNVKFEPNHELKTYMANIELPNGLYKMGGKKIVLTGFDDTKKYCLQVAFERVGAKIQALPNSKTDLMIIGENPGPKKLKTAEESGIETIEFGPEFIDYFDLASVDFLG